MRKYSAFFKVFEQKQLFDYEPEGIEQSPCNKVPACTVPKTGCRPDDKYVYVPTELAFSVAAERNINIFTKPCGKGYMLATPEFRCGFGYVRIIEIFFKLKAEHFSQADCHVRISGKVKINLEGESGNGKPCTENGQISAVI